MFKFHLKMVCLMITFHLLVSALQANDSNTTLYMYIHVCSQQQLQLLFKVAFASDKTLNTYSVLLILKMISLILFFRPLVCTCYITLPEVSVVMGLCIAGGYMYMKE